MGTFQACGIGADADADVGLALPPASTFAPTNVQPEQWIKALASAGVTRAVLVVSHGGVVYALEEACGEPWRRLPNLGARWFEVSGGDLSAGPRVDLVPDGTVPNLL